MNDTKHKSMYMDDTTPGGIQKNNTKLVCFDLDDTLIREIHSVMLPCILNKKEKEHARIQNKEDIGELDYITADYHRVKLLEGLAESAIKSSFLEVAKPLKNIRKTVETLHNHDILCIVITVGPKQVAKVACDIWGFDGYYGSNYEVKNGKFTGKILKFNKAEHKKDCLMDFCGRNRIKLNECVAVGDGATDIPMFECCRESIAINASPQVQQKTTHFVDTDDLTDIMKYILTS